MSWPASFFFPHTVSVRDYRSSGGRGSEYAAPRSLGAEVKDEQTLVRNADGDEVVSSTNVTVPLNAEVPLESLVTVWVGKGSAERESVVIAVARNENPPPLPSYLVLSLK